MNETEALFGALRQAADPATAAALERLVREAPDHALNKINALDLATTQELDQNRLISTLLHAARLGLFEMSWNVICRSCAGTLDANTSLKTLNRPEYRCAFCAAGYETTLDNMVEVTFTVSPRVRKIAAHDPNTLSPLEYYRQIFWSSAIDLPSDYESVMDEATLDAVELEPGERAILSLQLPGEMLIVFDPVTHAAQFLKAAGEPTRERQNLSLSCTNVRVDPQTIEVRPGPVRLALDNRSATRALPTVWVTNSALESLLQKHKPVLTAKQLLTNHTFRDLYRTDTLAIDQRLKITSLTFLFTDLRGSTDLYERVGDLVAFELVKEHFRVLHDIIASEHGAVVKTIGDAVMASFAEPERAVAAALRMREAIGKLGAERGQDGLLLKMGIHEGPCLAVTLNDQQDYFGQTVNIASRVQGLADSRAIVATGRVLHDPRAASLVEKHGLKLSSRNASLRGIPEAMAVYEIP